MTTEPTEQPEGANWGDPAPAAATATKAAWTGKKTAIAAGIAVVIAAGGGAAIWAGTSSGSTTAQQGGPGGFGGPGGGQFGGPGGQSGALGGGMAALREALHGDFVVANSSGGYTTERLQTGDVTELSATSVTLTSKDGYKQTYTIDTSTQKSGDVKQGDTNITVVAKVDGQTATATSLGAAQQQRQPGQGGTRRNGGSNSARPSQ